MNNVAAPGLDALYTALGIPESRSGERFRALGDEVRYKKGEKLPLHLNNEPRLYFLLSGCTCCEAETPDGRDVLECICYRPFKAVNPVGMFTGTGEVERCICLTDSCFAVFPLSPVIELVQGDIELMGIYSRCLKEALGEQTRHKYMLSLRSEERYIWFLKYYSDMPEQISQRTVARFLNMDPATLARIRMKMKSA